MCILSGQYSSGWRNTVPAGFSGEANPGILGWMKKTFVLTLVLICVGCRDHVTHFVALPSPPAQLARVKAESADLATPIESATPSTGETIASIPEHSEPV